jgi:hypothetical protein
MQETWAKDKSWGWGWEGECIPRAVTSYLLPNLLLSLPMSPLETVQALLNKALERSPVVKFLREARATTAEATSRARALGSAEIAGLEARGNLCADWAEVRISGTGTLEAIRGCRFEGSVILRLENGGATLWNSRFRDVIVGAATVENAGWVRRARIEDGAFVSNVGEISGRKNSRFCLGRFLQPGSETGGRKIFLLDGLTVAECAAMAALTPSEQDAIATWLDAALAGLETDHAYVGAEARLEHAVVVENCFVGPGATVRGAATLQDSILASTLDAPVHVAEASIVRDSVLDEGVGVHGGAQVTRSILLEFSGAEHAGQVADSVLGPGTIMAKGEITASLVGPFTGLHHQSLLIGALWPEGHGNVGYGANVGSNHTGRKPDQELRAGEGTFFGLGCSIKFPANFEAAPYSLFASGVLADPQKIAFPFSLITSSQEAIHGLNEIAPGWMWGENAYALIRNAYKYADRNRALRHAVPALAPPPENVLAGTFLAADLFAPRIAGFVRAALEALMQAEPGKVIPGLGANFLHPSRIAKARAAYENYLAFVQVREALWSGKKAPQEVAGLFETFAASVEKSLAKDAERGSRIFEDYAEFHPAPASDAVCLRLRSDLAKIQAAWG